MNDLPHPDYHNMPLHPNQKSFTFQNQTNWHVIAGAPSAGKTTLIELFAQKGFNTRPEPPRLYLDKEIAKGRTVQQIRAEEKDLQHIFMNLQVELERTLPHDELLFLDRGIPDQFTYCRMFGVDPNIFLKDCFIHRYASVFILAPLPFEKDGYRDPEAEIVDYFDEWITRDYHALGYTTIRVPVMSLEERLTYIISKINDHGLGNLMDTLTLLH